MAAIVWDSTEWAKAQFEACELGDLRRNKRLIKLAGQIVDRPEAGTPTQTETWGDLKAAYRLFDTDDVTPTALLSPHRRAVRDACRPGDVKLIVSDTTELSFGRRPAESGLGLTGRGQSRGLVAHTALMIDAGGGQVDGIAAQELFSRVPKAKKLGGKKPLKNTVRRSPERESVVWGRVIDDVGAPPAGVKYLHVCDRGADDFEVFQRARARSCGFVIRASKLNRIVLTETDERLPLSELLKTLPVGGEQAASVPAKGGRPARQATLSLRWSAIRMPKPSVLTPWLKERRPIEPLKLNVVEAVEHHPPKGVAPLRWVLFTTESVATKQEAGAIIEHYKKRWTVEDFHKAWKTGCGVETRLYETADRLGRVATVLAIVAVRLLQLRTAAKETPDVAAESVAPKSWVKMLRAARKMPADKPLTIRDFVRHLAGLGGFLMRKGDGEPGWQSLWRGHEKLQLMLRGADATKKCG